MATHTKGAPWPRLSAAPAFKHRVRGGAKNAALFEACYKAWRVGLIDDWYHGTRSDDDDTLIWQIDGRELSHDHIRDLLRRYAENVGIASIEWGPSWCGYRGVEVTYADGRVLREEWNGHEVIVSESRLAA